MTPTASRRRILASTAGLVVGGGAFLAALLNLGRDLDRTALGNGFYSGVYELQARSFLEGSIALPDGSMGIEGFERGGQTFMYFPPFPALLRLPVLMTTNEFDGRLTVLSMALAWIVFAAMTTKLAWLVLERVSGTVEVSRSGAALVAVFLACATGGTFLTYDASLPWVYHEVYMWAVAAAVGACYWMARVLMRPDPHAARWLGMFCLAAIGTRATEGWAICLVVLGIAAWMRFRPVSPEHRRLWLGVVLAAALPLALSIALNVYKFDHVLLFPLEDQVWTSINDRRREALEVNGGSITGPQFFTTSFMAYFRPDGIRFVDYFPFITLPAEPAPAFSGAFVDQAYRTGSATSFMTLLLMLTIASIVTLVGPWAPARTRVLRAPLFAAVLITGGVMGYGYYAARYTSEFVPALVVGGAIGTALLAGLVARRPVLRAPALVFTGALTAFAVVAQLAVGTATAATYARGDDLRRYLEWQGSVSPEEQARLVTTTGDLPKGGSTDQLAVRGNCEALYLNTGDVYEPWVTVESLDVALDVRPGEAPRRDGEVVLFEVPESGQIVRLETENDELRVVLEDDDGEFGGPWTRFPPEGYLRVALRELTEFGALSVTQSRAGLVGYLRSTYPDDDWVTHPTTLVQNPGLASEVGRLGLEVEQVDTLPLPLCNQLARRAGIDVAGD